MRRAARIGLWIGTAMLAAAAPGSARAEIWVVLENPNSAAAQDLYELFDRVCNVELPAVALRGHGAASFPICGGLSKPGSLKIRYSGEDVWTEIGGLHGWSVIEAPRRPMGTRIKPPPADDDGGE
jgi:hypothetical protein